MVHSTYILAFIKSTIKKVIFIDTIVDKGN